MQPPPEPTSRAHVLIVDDDAGVRDVCTVMLRSLGYDAKSESSGPRALEAVESAPVEVVLLDLEMPKMGGDEVLKSLKARRPWVRVVVMSGRPAADLRDCLRSGADAVIQKPFRLSELNSSVQAALTH